jgi:hypothetical protein
MTSSCFPNFESLHSMENLIDQNYILKTANHRTFGSNSSNFSSNQPIPNIA